MKKALFMIAAAATFIFAGCQKEQGAQQIAAESKDIIHINIEQMAPATKVAANDITADPLTFKWEEGDSVAFWEITNMLSYTCTKVKTYSCTDPEEGIFESTDGAVLDPSTSYTAVYPADYDFNGAMQATLSHTVHTTFSTYRGNALPREHLILAQSVQGNATSFTLDAHSSVLHFKLKGNANIGSIEYMAGNDSEASTILSCGEGIQLSGEPTDFYLDAIHTNGSGFKLVFKDPDDTVLGEKTSSSDLTLQIGKMVDFTEVVTVNAAYSITGNVTPTSSGTVTFKKNGGSTGITQASYGDEITVEATPNTGYTLKSITWAPDGGSDTDITSAKTFTMPAKNVTVTATFEEPLTGEINGRAYVKIGGKK